MKLSRCKSILAYTVLYLLLMAVLLLATAACSRKDNAPAVLRRQGWVSDYANKLGPEENERISASIASYEKETCHQIFLLIIPTLGGENMVDFSQRTATAWEIGQPGLGNGFLITVALKEGKVRIETGSVFEWFIQDGTAAKILKEAIIPLFREGRFFEGLERGLKEIMQAGRRKEIPESQRPEFCRQEN